MDVGRDFLAMADNLREGLYLVDRDRRVTFWNRAAERITGFSSVETVGRKCSDNILVHVDSEGCHLCLDGCPLVATMGDGEPREAEVFLHHKLGHRVPVTVRSSPLTDGPGNVVGCAELFSDDTPRESLESRVQELEQLALLDPLTKLPNRRYMESQVEAGIGLFQRSRVPFGLIFVDVDHFKRFNDTYGHEVGDKALMTVTQTMSASVRPFDTIGRWGGEEFVGVFPNCDSAGTAAMAQRLCMLVRNSWVETQEGAQSITVSIGGSVVKDGDTLESIVSRADALMYRQKQAGRDGVLVD